MELKSYQVAYCNRNNKYDFLNIEIIDESFEGEILLEIVLDGIKREFYLSNINKNLFNIVTYNIKDVVVFSAHKDKIKIFTSNERILSKMTKWMDDKNEIKNEKFKNIIVRNKTRGNKKKPKKILILCPSFSGFFSNKYVITEYSSLPKEIVDEILVISLQDYYDALGTYFLVDNKGKLVFKTYVNFIQDKLNKYNLNEEDLIFSGGSKGGAVAIMFGYEFPKSSVMPMAPNIVSEKLYNSNPNFFSYYKGMFEQFKFDYKKELNLENKFLEMIKRGQKIKLFYGEKDYFSNSSKVANCFENDNLEYFSYPNGHEALNICTPQVLYEFSKEYIDYENVNVDNLKINGYSPKAECFNFAFEYNEPIKFENSKTIHSRLIFEDSNKKVKKVLNVTNLLNDDEKIKILCLPAYKALNLAYYLEKGKYRITFQTIDVTAKKIYTLDFKKELYIDVK